MFLAQRAELESVYRVYCQNHDEAIALLETYEKDEKMQKLLLDLLDSLRLEPQAVVATTGVGREGQSPASLPLCQQCLNSSGGDWRGTGCVPV